VYDFEVKDSCFSVLHLTLSLTNLQYLTALIVYTDRQMRLGADNVNFSASSHTHVHNELVRVPWIRLTSNISDEAGRVETRLFVNKCVVEWTKNGWLLKT